MFKNSNLEFHTLFFRWRVLQLNSSFYHNPLHMNVNLLLFVGEHAVATVDKLEVPFV